MRFLIIVQLTSFFLLGADDNAFNLMVKISDNLGEPIPDVEIEVIKSSKTVPGGMFGRIERKKEKFLNDERGLVEITVYVGERHRVGGFTIHDKKGFYSGIGFDFTVDELVEISSRRSLRY